jgi:sulfatase maturation enzyme AslB (radical SAM superfamily)
MDSLATARILNLRDLKVLHIEPTDVCQAACPLCDRETDPTFDKHDQHHLTVDQISAVVSDQQIRNLNKMFMCGQYGDPAAGKHTQEIYQYFRSVNPTITLGMNSNGALQNRSWWYDLGRLFNQSRDYVVFSIDGLADTNHIYRRNVDWVKLMNNIRGYISAGGSAHWDMLVYQHNEHQVDECERLARDIGFTWFRAKVSRRGFSNVLQIPTDWQLPVAAQGPINCHALNESSAYIDAQGRMSPCCWLAGRKFIPEDQFNQIQQTWNTDTQNQTCKATCSGSTKTPFTSQWQREKSLKPH